MKLPGKNESLTTIPRPLYNPSNEWEASIKADWGNSSVYTDKAPNWFSRIIFKWFLDIHWRKIAKD